MVLQLTNNVKDVQITTGSIQNSLKPDEVLDELNKSIEATLAAREKINHDVVTERPDQYVPPPPITISDPVKPVDIGQFGGGDFDLSKYADDLDGAGALNTKNGGGSGNGSGNESGSGDGGGESVINGFFTFIKVLVFILLIAIVIIAFKNRKAIEEKMKKL